MLVNLVISENCCNFIVLNYKRLQAVITMTTESKIIELFCMADDFCKFFDTMMSEYTLKTCHKALISPCLNHVKGRNHAHNDTFP